MSTSTTQRTVTVHRDRDAVAAYVLDFTTSAEWDPHTVRCDRVDDGPVRVGARYENVQRLLGRETPMRYEVVEYEPGRRLVLEGGTDDVRTRDEITVDDAAGGATTVTYTVHLDLHGKARLAAPLMPVAMSRIASDGEAHLHEVLEARLPG